MAYKMTNIMATNHSLVCFCAVANCLSCDSGVNYAVRDYVLEQIDRFQDWELTRMVKMIECATTIPQIDMPFWNNFADKLMQKALDKNNKD